MDIILNYLKRKNEDTLLLWLSNNERVFSGETLANEAEYVINGELRHFYDIVAPVYIDNNIKSILGVNIDITELRKAEQKLKESEKRLFTLLDGLPAFIYLQAPDYSIRYANLYFQEKFGNDLKRKCYEAFNNYNEPCENCPTFKVFDTWTPQKWEWKSPIGEIFQIYDYPFKDLDGSSFVLELGIDITQRKKAENELKELSTMKSEFLRRASHELKTPLISIKGFSDLILSLYADKLDTVILTNLREINDGCERLQNIINNLLKTSQLESPDLKPKLQKEDLTFLIKFCVHELESLSERRKQSIKIDIHSELFVNIEKEEIHDVLSNLLTNAIKYTPPSGKIVIKTKLDEKLVVVSVTDNGIGFTEEQKTKIFQQFGKIERYGQGLDLGIDGTGLGLYISKRIVESHGGNIWMESEGKNKGTTFYFSLPNVE